MPVKFLGVNINPLLEVNVIFFFFFPFCFIFKGCIFHSLSNGHYFFFVTLCCAYLASLYNKPLQNSHGSVCFFFVLRGTSQDLAYV